MSAEGAVSAGQAPVTKCHDWQPVPKWSGRYRCSVCGALGYRGIVTSTPLEEGEEQAAWQAKTHQRRATIFPYVCKAKGCKAHAVDFGKYQFCRAHKTPPASVPPASAHPGDVMTDQELDELNARDPRAAQIEALKAVFRCSSESAERMWERANTVPCPPYVPSLGTESYDEVARKDERRYGPTPGKLVLDSLMEVDPEFAESIRGGVYDPTHFPGHICRMLVAWRTHLTGR